MVFECCLLYKEHKNTLINNFQKKICEDVINNDPNVVFVNNFQDIYKWLKDKNIKNLILPYETVGNKVFYESDFLKTITNLEVKYTFYLREWDSNAFQLATKGFFNFKKNISSLLNQANIKNRI